MFDKLIRNLLLTVVVASFSLVGYGWKLYAKVDEKTKSIKEEIKAEMVEIRNRDMEYINQRMNGLEIITAGRIVNQVPVPKANN
jgi:hypothetical protein